MTRKLLGAFVAAAFAIGFLSGAAGTIVAHEPPTGVDFSAQMADHMAGTDMSAMMSGGMGSMMGPGSSFGPGMMSGPGASFGPGMMSGPAASAMPGNQHDLHHPVAGPDGSK